MAADEGIRADRAYEGYGRIILSASMALSLLFRCRQEHFLGDRRNSARGAVLPAPAGGYQGVAEGGCEEKVFNEGRYNGDLA
jgi:hypothetical protein